MRHYQNIYQSAREGAGLTQETAAERLGWSVRSVQDIEQNSRKPSPEKVAQMAALYGAHWLRGYYCNRCPLGEAGNLPEQDCDLQQFAIEVGLTCNDPDHLRRMSLRLMEIALDRTISDDELPDYMECARLLTHLKMLAEKAQIVLAGALSTQNKKRPTVLTTPTGAKENRVLTG